MFSVATACDVQQVRFFLGGKTFLISFSEGRREEYAVTVMFFWGAVNLVSFIVIAKVLQTVTYA